MRRYHVSKSALVGAVRWPAGVADRGTGDDGARGVADVGGDSGSSFDRAAPEDACFLKGGRATGVTAVDEAAELVDELLGVGDAVGAG